MITFISRIELYTKEDFCPSIHIIIGNVVIQQSFKNKICLLHGEGNKIISNKTQTFSILTKRAMLRIGMLLTTSEIAKQVRTHLLNCEEEVSQEKQIWLAQREAGKIDRKRMTTAIKNYIPDSPHKKFKYPQYTNLVYKILFNYYSATGSEPIVISQRTFLRLSVPSAGLVSTYPGKASIT